ncbi:MAG: GAF domain-containing sensor histidine kinase [Anaerolineae bacterium]|nr:GAF domain-containing sensor histidine kinase [Anaerolineae bacterium]
MTIFTDEINTLYIASNKLTQAATPVEQLEAISDYARSNDASWGILIYLDDEGRTEEVVAEWTIGRAIPLGIGAKFPVLDHDVQSEMSSARIRPHFIQDTLKEDHINPPILSAAKLHQMRSAVILPLYNKGRWIAEILFGWEGVCNFDERDQRVYTALQQQAASAIDSVRLFEQTQKRATELETAKQEIDLLHDALRKLTRASTRKELLMAVSEYPREIGAYNGQMFYFNQPQLDHVETVATWGTVPEIETPVGLVIDLTRRAFCAYWLSRPDTPTFITDIMTDDHVDLTSRVIFTDIHARAMAVLPLHTKGRWIGVITFYWDKPYKFDDRDTRIFTGLHQQLAPVVESIRLFEQSEQRATELEIAKREMDILYTALRQLMQATTPNEQLEAVSDYARNTGAASGALSYFIENEFDEEVVAEWCSGQVLPAGIGTHFYTNGENSEQTWLHIPGMPTLLADATDDPRIAPEILEIVLLNKTRAMALLPLYNKGRWIGLLVFRWAIPRDFNERDYRVYAALQQQAAPVVDSIRLFEQARQLAAFEERTRLARELHDSVSQALYGIGLGARTAKSLLKIDPSRLNEPLDYILSLAEAGMTEMRALIFELRPESIEQEGLVIALGKQASSVQARHAIHVMTEFCEEPALPIETKEGLYRIAREALHNAVKHAQATEVWLSFLHTSDGYALELVDNGNGFDVSKSFPGHLGLKSMRERTEALDGQLEIESTEGKGTRIMVKIPS